MDGLEQAKATLEATIDIAENNAPINEAEGNVAQAALERRTAEECRAVLTLIDDEMDELERAMSDSNSDYWKGRLASGKQARFRKLVRAKESILKSI